MSERWEQGLGRASQTLRTVPIGEEERTTLRIIPASKREEKRGPLCATSPYHRGIQGVSPFVYPIVTSFGQGERSNSAHSLLSTVTGITTLTLTFSLTHGFLPDWAPRCLSTPRTGGSVTCRPTAGQWGMLGIPRVVYPAYTQGGVYPPWYQDIYTGGVYPPWSSFPYPGYIHHGPLSHIRRYNTQHASLSYPEV